MIEEIGSFKREQKLDDDRVLREFNDLKEDIFIESGDISGLKIRRNILNKKGKLSENETIELSELDSEIKTRESDLGHLRERLNILSKKIEEKKEEVK